MFGATGSTSMDSSFAGASACATYWRMSSFQRTMSIFSPESSLTIVLTRLPRCPTHAPTGSTFSLDVLTASFARKPGSRLTPMISTTPSAISLTSRRKSASTNLPLARERITLGPCASGSTRRTIARMGSPTW